jgi:polar amino acid transport system substrate-binding protein
MRLLFVIIVQLFIVTTLWADPVKKRPIVVGVDPDFPPFESLAVDGSIVGLNIDLANAVGKALGLEIKFVHAQRLNLRTMLVTGQVDLISVINSKEYYPVIMSFAVPHSQIFLSAWSRHDGGSVVVSHLDKPEVLVEKDSVTHRYLESRSDLDFNTIPVDTFEDALRLLAIGKADVVVGPKLPGEYLLGRLQISNVRPLARPMKQLNYSFAAKKENSELLALFDKGLSVVKREGTYERIYNKWLGLLPQQEGWPAEKIFKTGAMLLSPLLLIIGLMAFWSYSLRRRVAMRTSELEIENAERLQAMAKVKQHQQQLMQADKMVSLGVIVSGVAHEINNPNAHILLNIPQLKRFWKDIQPILKDKLEESEDFFPGRISFGQINREFSDILDEMQTSSEKIKYIINDLKDFAVKEDGEIAMQVDLNKIAKDAERLVIAYINKATNHFSVELSSVVPMVQGNAQRIEQVIVNLLLNATQALTAPTQPIFLRTGFLKESKEVFVEVEDCGSGVEPENLSGLTDPFFTTRQKDGGTGLGLSISSKIAREHRGRLEFVSYPGEGMRVQLILPSVGNDAYKF